MQKPDVKGRSASREGGKRRTARREDAKGRSAWKEGLLTGCLLLLFLASLFLKVYYLESGSMAPAYPAGTYVIAADLGEPETGDVCAYRHNGIIVVHRVIRKTGNSYIFQGDANNTEDPYPVSTEEIEARVLFGIPRLHLIFFNH